MLFKVDSTNTFGEFVAVEEAGSYNVRISNAELKTSHAGNSMLVVDYEVTDGKYQGGTIRFDHIVWSDYNEEALNLSIKRFNTLLVATGVNDGTEINSLDAVARGLVGRELGITVDWDTEPNNKGRYNLRVKARFAKMASGSKPNGKREPNQAPTNSATAMVNGFNQSRQQQAPTQNGWGSPNQGAPTNQSFNQSPTNSATRMGKGEQVDIQDDDLPF
ncbi:DUF669 domain-containing protein [Ligilactobacillus equi]|uniref:DUF669 domain-containing protein n=1 Tax=Ligilactobacillus equi DSM 15833 = JCM 10991 TaxID=1423740 RepID=A0A0R1TTG4_9LACO|nr:DUF669 domain-containing protein [Ligilactobacillus equi]KRL81778.1 hypothetical protein FC36_GL001370 [Ligilactobacillus equi DSM 15833 = JCM 10991]